MSDLLSCLMDVCGNQECKKAFVEKTLFTHRHLQLLIDLSETLNIIFEYNI